MVWQLYPPKEWADDEPLLDQGAPKRSLLANAGCSVDTAFRERLGELGLDDMVAVTGQVTAWPPRHAPLPPLACSGRGNMPTRQRLGEAVHGRRQAMKKLALALPPTQWRTLERREGTN